MRDSVKIQFQFTMKNMYIIEQNSAGSDCSRSIYNPNKVTGPVLLVSLQPAAAEVQFLRVFYRLKTALWRDIAWPKCDSVPAVTLAVLVLRPYKYEDLSAPLVRLSSGYLCASLFLALFWFLVRSAAA